MKPVFETKRLRVFLITVEPSDYCASDKDVFIAFRTDQEWAAPVVVATIATAFQSIGDWVEWIETVSDMRREGLAAELVAGIEKHYGRDLELTGATPEGEAFCEAIEARLPPLAD